MTIGTKIVGKYNVDYCGAVYDGKIKYEMVIISEFDSNDREISRSIYYFLCGEDLITPEFQTEADVEKITKYYQNNAKIKAWKAFHTSIIEKMI